MFISHDYRFIFIKTHKTAGSSIEQFFLNSITENFVFAGMPYENLLPINSKKCKEHAHWQQIMNKFPKEWKNYYKVSVDRNVWDRIVSLFYWHKKVKNIKEKRISTFEDYVKNKKKFYLTIRNWKMYTKSNQLVVDKVLSYENLNEDFSEFCKIVGIQYKNNLKNIFLKSGVRKLKDYRSHYSSETKEIIRDLHQEEIDYFNWSF